MKTDSLPWPARDILVAACLLTRLPLPRLPDAAFERSAQATWAYPIAGLVLGSIGALIAYVAIGLGLPNTLAAGVTIAGLLVCSGAMHEDGLADVADGFWGGNTASQRLEIMKDSQIGSYGTLALIISVGLRWTAYAYLLSQSLLAIVVVAMISRAAMPILMNKLPHARQNGLSHSVGRPDAQSALTAFAIGTLLAFVFVGWIAFLVALAVALCAILMAWLSQMKIGGQTGDVLGATQQVGETAALLTLTALL